MAEKLLTISKKQHDTVNELTAGIKTLQDRLSLVASVIIQGADEEIPAAGVDGARCVDGVYSLVLSLPDIAPAIAPAVNE